MIIENRLIFGYGDIGVGFNNFGLTFTQLKPPAEVGATLNPEYCSKHEIEFGKEYNLTMNLDDVHELKRMINKVTKNNCIFEYKGFIFDFSKYNEGSIDVVKKKLGNPPFFFLLPYAC